MIGRLQEHPVPSSLDHLSLELSRPSGVPPLPVGVHSPEIEREILAHPLQALIGGAYDELNHSFHGLIHTTEEEGSTCVTFEGLGRYDTITVDLDQRHRLLTVTGENSRSASDKSAEGLRYSAGASRRVVLPRAILFPETVVAGATCSGSVVVTIPHDAQAVKQAVPRPLKVDYEARPQGQRL